MLALGLAGCGGSGPPEARRTVTGGDYLFSAPAGWAVGRAGRTVSASSGSDIVSVTIFRLARPYRPQLWSTVVPELDRVAAELAVRLGGSRPAGRTLLVGGRRARSYEIAFARGGRKLVERVTFVLRGRREYQLLCRWSADSPEGGRAACRTLVSSFRRA